MTIGVLVKAVLPNVSGVPADDVTMDFAFVPTVGVADEDLAEACCNAVASLFLTDTPTNGWPIGTLIGNAIARTANACETRGYLVPGEPGVKPAGQAADMGSPVAVQTFTMPACNDVRDFPEEVAVVLSYNADLVGVPREEVVNGVLTRPQASRMGRVYFGPLIWGFANQATALTPVRPHAPYCEGLIDAADIMATLANNGGAKWGVFSRKQWQIREVVGANVDNAFDTVRSRGLAMTSRVTRAISQS